jgi:TPP-dependent pyruvate/acetoin dehydrogenase alpha subunit
MKSIKDIKIKLDLLRTMLLIRGFENGALDLFSRDLIRGSIHVYNGQEAVAAGVCKNLDIKKGDCITTTHRGHGHVIAMDADIKKMMAELLGRDTGLNRGRGGSMHIADKEKGVYGANGIVSGGISIACGLAFVSTYKNEDSVTVVFFGEGAANEGGVYESLNFSVIWDLPVIFVCENNGYAQTTPVHDTQSTAEIRNRAAGFGIENTLIDGNDVEEVYVRSRKIIDKVRKEKRPSFIEVKTYRQKGHWQGDPEVYRTKEEVGKWSKDRCPIKNYEKKLIEKYGLDPKKISQIKKEVENEIETAKEFALKSSFPDSRTLMDFNYI